MIDHATFHELQAQAGAEFVAGLVASFEDDATRMLAELRQAAGAGAADSFRRAAHSLKSNARTFGATRLAEMARALELGGPPAVAERSQAFAALETECQRAIAALRALARG